MSWSASKSLDATQPIDALSLSSQVVINTRPVERAAPLTQHLQAAGMTVVDMPMLTLEARATTEQDLTLMRHWFAGDYQALVIVSPTAAASGLAVWQALERDRQQAQALEIQGSGQQVKPSESQVLKAPSHLIAVGEATAAVLNDAKLEAASYQVLQPVVANNEGMLAMPEIENLKSGDKMLVWRGLGGRRLLVNTLQARGVHIDSIAWYERKMPDAAMGQYEQWQAQYLMQSAESPQSLVPKPIVIVSSGTAFEHWKDIVDSAAAKMTITAPDLNKATCTPLQLHDFAYVVLGARLADMVADQQLQYWRVEDLMPETILAAIKPTND